MRKFLFVLCCGIAVLASGVTGARSQAASPSGQTKPEEQFKPRWQLGQRWLIETTRTAFHTDEPTRVGKPVRWQFTVLGRERVGGKLCFRTEIICKSIEGVPATTIWVDEKTLTLVQVETGLIVQGEVRWLKERYDSASSSGSPVVSPLGPVPLDLPVFATKRPNADLYEYKALQVDEDDRPADDLVFAVEVRQNIKQARGKQTYQVSLKSSGREVRQLWKAGQPWPSFSSNGGTTSRLVHVSDTLVAVADVAETAVRRTAQTPRVAIDRSGMVINGTDEGRSRVKPWSGYWFQKRQGWMIRHLRKHDMVTGKQAASWEARQKDPRTALQWAGYCHAWAAASVMEREPRGPRTVKGANGRSITLSVADQKAWLTICHDDDESDHWGKRYPDGDYQDIYPDVLWKCLRTYVKQRGVPLIIDRDPGPAVWNHPVYQYRVTHRPFGSNGQRLATMEIWMADDQVPPSFVGTKTMKKTYQFTFRLKGKALVMGSAKWYGHSQKDHPDFAWYPTLVKAKNPYVKPTVVRRMLGGARSSATVRRVSDRSSLELFRTDDASDLFRTAWTER
jgi:hypothetical protein